MSALTKFQPKLTPGHLRYHVDGEKIIDGYLQCDGSIVLKNSYPDLVDAIGYIKDGSLELTGTLQTSGTANKINDLIYANNQYVYVANGGVVGTSSSGTQWTSATPLAENINSIIYANNQFVVVGNNGLVATSSNAITWTTRTSGTTVNINDITYGNGIFVYVADAEIIATSNDAITWTTQIPADLNASYVGGKTSSRAGSTSTTSVSLTDLTGGLSSAPIEGDIVFIAVATGSSTTRSQEVTGYTQLASLNSSDQQDTNLFVGYKVMTATPDTTVTIPSTGSADDAQTVAIQVWRGIDLDEFIINVANITGTNTVLVNPAAVAPTSNSLLLIAGAGGHTSGVSSYTASYLSNFLTASADDVNDSVIGFGSITLTAGLYDPAAWTYSTTDSINFSYAATSILITRKDIKKIKYGNNKFIYVADSRSSSYLEESSNATTWTDISSLNYVGGKTFSRVGNTSPEIVSLTDLTGGLSSAPAANDIVFVAVATGSTTSRSMAVTDYTQVTSLYSDDTNDTNLFVGYRVMGATPNTDVTIPSSGSLNDAQTVAIQVWRGVDSTIFDVTSTTVTQTNTVLVNPPAITTVSNNTVLLVIGAGGHAAGNFTYTAPYLSNFLTIIGNDTIDSTIGFGSILRPEAGTYDPDQWAFGTSDQTSYSSASVTIALKPIVGKPIKALEFLNNTFIFAGETGTVSTSTDGSNWTARTTGSTETFNAITYDDFDSLYAVIGTGTSFFTSPDAVTWTARTKSTSTQMNAFAYDSGLFVYAGDSGILGTSSFYTYDPPWEFALPTTVSHTDVFTESSFSVFSPKAYIKYE